MYLNNDDDINVHNTYDKHILGGPRHKQHPII